MAGIKMTRHKQKFTGALATPVEGVPIRFRLDEVGGTKDQKWQKANSILEHHKQRITVELITKIPLLADHYGLDDKELGSSRIVYLVIELAQQLGIPGFQVVSSNQPGAKVRKVGRPRTSSDPYRI